LATTPILEIVTPDAGSQYALVQDLAAMADTVEDAILHPVYTRLTSTRGLSLTSTEHPFQIGPDSGSNLRLDNNEIQSVNNGGAEALYLQNQGGDLLLGNQNSLITARGGFEEGWTALGDIDLNQVVRGGRYVQTSSAFPTYARHYPVERTGVLEVISNAWAGASGGVRFQRYTNYNIPMTWVRSWNATDGWSQWANITPLSGFYDFTNLSANTTSSRTFTFPSGAFRPGYTPAVTATGNTGGPQVLSGPTTSSVSNTGFTLNVRRTDAAESMRVFWMAM